MPKIPKRKSLAQTLRGKGVNLNPIVWIPKPEILLGANIPKPLHGVAPRVVLGVSWWNKEREKAYASTNYHCIACEVHKIKAKYVKHLEGHEVYAIDYLKGRSVYIETVPLCHFCHNYIHSGRLEALLNAGKIHHAKYTSIIQHGDSILAKSKLTKPIPYSGPFADWKDWRLVVNGNEYPPLYKTFEEWSRNMDKWNDE